MTFAKLTRDYTGDPQLLQQTVEGSDDLAMVATIVVGFRFIAPNERRPPQRRLTFHRFSHYFSFSSSARSAS